MQVNVTDVELVEAPEEGVEEEGVGFEGGFGVSGFEHLVVDVEGAGEEEAAGAAEADHGVVEWGGRGAGAGEDFVD